MEQRHACAEVAVAHDRMSIPETDEPRPRASGIVMEYVEGQNLMEYLVEHGGSLREDAARFLFQQLIVAVSGHLIVAVSGRPCPHALL